MATLHFRNGAVYLTSGAGAAVIISEAKGFSLNITRDLADDSAFGDTWKTRVIGLRDWSGSFDVNFDTAQATLFNAVTTATSAQPIYLYPDRSSTGRYYYGTVWPELSAQGDLNSVGTGTVNFQGDGQFAAN